MKNLLRSFAALGLLFSIEAQAHEPRVSRYRVDEVHAPDSLKAGCLDGYAAGASIRRINDFGLVNGNFTCYT